MANIALNLDDEFLINIMTLMSTLNPADDNKINGVHPVFIQNSFIDRGLYNNTMAEVYYSANSSSANTSSTGNSLRDSTLTNDLEMGKTQFRRSSDARKSKQLNIPSST